jgi:hypothetical protein
MGYQIGFPVGRMFHGPIHGQLMVSVAPYLV